MRHWQRRTLVSAALYPLSLIFRAVTALRRVAYARGILRRIRIGVPVVIAGNISVGGTGKTPLVLWLAHLLRRNGMQPGIVSRGYRGSATHPLEVTAASDPAEVGDEPLLLARRSGCPVWIGRDRVAAAQSLLAAHPTCDVIISDDGLQHYRLARDVEIAVVDGDRGLGNGLLLPAGPLREPASRLDSVDAVVVNGRGPSSALHPSTSSARTEFRASTSAGRREFSMQLEGSRFLSLVGPDRVVHAEHFKGKRVYAIAGIGHPPRFFAHLEALGLAFERRAFPDHHEYVASDIDFADADAVVMTEKDAVKCAAFARPIHWVLPVDAAPDPQLGELVLRKLNVGSSR
jgi:tetraacyldisaccharide 4'-kinase